MKRFLAGLVVGLVLATGVSVMAANQPVKLFVNGREIAFPDAPPQILNGRTMVPARPLAEALGAKVEWDAKNWTVVVSTDSAAKATGADASAPFVGAIRVNGQSYTASLSYNEAGVVCVPLRTVSEFASVGSPADVPRETVVIEVDGKRLTKEQMWSYQGRSFICADAMVQTLSWSASWDSGSLTLTIAK